MDRASAAPNLSGYSPLVGKSKSYYELLVKKLFSIRSFLNKINADVETEVIKGQLFRIRAGWNIANVCGNLRIVISIAAETPWEYHAKFYPPLMHIRVRHMIKSCHITSKTTYFCLKGTYESHRTGPQIH